MSGEGETWSSMGWDNYSRSCAPLNPLSAGFSNLWTETDNAVQNVPLYFLPIYLLALYEKGPGLYLCPFHRHSQGAYERSRGPQSHRGREGSGGQRSAQVGTSGLLLDGSCHVECLQPGWLPAWITHLVAIRAGWWLREEQLLWR